MKKTVFLIFIIASIQVFPQGGKNYYDIKGEDFLQLSKNDATKGFISIGDFFVDDEGSVFVIDAKQFTAFKFSNEGKLQLTVGKKGSGPGEFNMGYRMKTSPSGTIYAFDFLKRQMQVFNKSGKFEKTIDFSKSNLIIADFVFTNENSIAAYSTELGKTEDNKPLFKEMIAKINLNNPDSFNPVIKKDKKDYFTNLFANIVKNKKGYFYFGGLSKDEYKVIQCDAEGNKIKEISRDFKHVRMKGKYLENFEKSIKLKKDAIKRLPSGSGLDSKSDDEPFFVSFYNLAIDKNENLWVFTSEKLNDKIISADLFDKNGNYKKTVYLNTGPCEYLRKQNYMLFGDYIYYIDYSTEGDEKLVRGKLPAEIWK